jgi:hypothetical protein
MKQLPKRTKYFFDQFIQVADDKEALHPLEWKQFYVFIQAAHEGRTNLLEYELEELLISKGFQSEMAKRLSDVYQHGRRLLESRVSLNYKYKP